MKTPKEKYANDNNYRRLVDMLEALIVQAEFTPSEIREACMLACIHKMGKHMFYFLHLPLSFCCSFLSYHIVDIN